LVRLRRAGFFVFFVVLLHDRNFLCWFRLGSQKAGVYGRALKKRTPIFGHDDQAGPTDCASSPPLFR